MSWSINAIGTPTAVKSVINKNNSVPISIKTALSEICDDQPYEGSGCDAIAIDGSGHGGNGSYVNNLKVTRFKTAKEGV